MSRMETRVAKIEEDLAEVKGALKSLPLKMEQKGEVGEQPIEAVEKERKGQRAFQPKQGRLDREALAQICWRGESSSRQKMAFVSAPNNTLELLTVAYPKDKIRREVYGDMLQTYKLHSECSRGSTVMKSGHIVARMEEALQRLVYESEYNRYWTAGEDWEKTPNEAASHILRLEALPRSRAEVAQLLDGVQFPQYVIIICTLCVHGGGSVTFHGSRCAPSSAA